MRCAAESPIVDARRITRPPGTRELVAALWPLRKYAGARIHLRGILRWRA